MIHFQEDLAIRDWDKIQHISFIEWALLFISIISSIYIPTKTKKYQLFDHDLNSQPQSMNVVIEELNLEQPEWSTKFPGSILLIFKSKVEADNTEFVWVLRQWDPPIFSLDLFCYFSPPQVICLQMCDKDNWGYLIPTALFIITQLTILRGVFFSYVEDNLLLYGEMLKEYNNKVVYQKLFKVQYEFGNNLLV
ncbi:5265_t:CDS:2 [Entrophospora sp. SA101]|nr:2796_t:CDS:2 [Entrophospora sp. SA101]CAJ0867194.1 5265_t:CDS:2 [Entrophospora sp. SA101]